MCMWLRQSTAAEVKIGPFVDATDGVTAETALTISQADVRLKKNDGDWAQKNETTAAAHEENGNYRCLLDTTDTNTLGRLELAVAESGALPVWREFMVVPANVWDSFFGADLLQTDLTQIGGDAQSATDLKDFADAGYDPATNKLEGVKLADTLTTYTGNTPQTGDGYAILNSGAHGNAALKTLIDALDAIADAIKLKTDSLTFTNALKVDATALTIGADAVDAAALKADAATEIAAAVFARAFSAAYGSHTYDELVKMIAAVLLGKASGMGTATGTFRNLADDADVIVVTQDAVGNRSAITRTP